MLVNACHIYLGPHFRVRSMCERRPGSSQPKGSGHGDKIKGWVSRRRHHSVYISLHIVFHPRSISHSTLHLHLQLLILYTDVYSRSRCRLHFSRSTLLLTHPDMSPWSTPSSPDLHCRTCVVRASKSSWISVWLVEDPGTYLQIQYGFLCGCYTNLRYALGMLAFLEHSFSSHASFYLSVACSSFCSHCSR